MTVHESLLPGLPGDPVVADRQSKSFSGLTTAVSVRRVTACQWMVRPPNRQQAAVQLQKQLGHPTLCTTQQSMLMGMYMALCTHRAGILLHTAILCLVC